MTKDKSTTLGLAVRHNQGKRHLAEFRAALAKGLGRAADSLVLVDLELTDSAFETLLRHRESLRSGAANAEFKIEMRTASESSLAYGLRAALEELGIRPLLLHRGLSELCGAARVQAAEVLTNVPSLVGLDEEAITAADPDGLAGVVVEYVTDPISVGTPTFLLLAWRDYHEL